MEVQTLLNTLPRNSMKWPNDCSETRRHGAEVDSPVFEWVIGNHAQLGTFWYSSALCRWILHIMHCTRGPLPVIGKARGGNGRMAGWAGRRDGRNARNGQVCTVTQANDFIDCKSNQWFFSLSAKLFAAKNCITGDATVLLAVNGPNRPDFSLGVRCTLAKQPAIRSHTLTYDPIVTNLFLYAGLLTGGQ